MTKNHASGIAMGIAIYDKRLFFGVRFGEVSLSS